MVSNITVFVRPDKVLVSNIRYFHPYLRTIQFDEHIFQMGWFNHQLVLGTFFSRFFRWRDGGFCKKADKNPCSHLFLLLFRKFVSFVACNSCMMSCIVHWLLATQTTLKAKTLNTKPGITPYWTAKVPRNRKIDTTWWVVSNLPMFFFPAEIRHEEPKEKNFYLVMELYGGGQIIMNSRAWQLW